MMTREGCAASFEPIESRAILAGLGLARSQAELPSVDSSTNVKKAAANEKLDELSSDDEETLQSKGFMNDFLKQNPLPCRCYNHHRVASATTTTQITRYSRRSISCVKQQRPTFNLRRWRVREHSTRR